MSFGAVTRAALTVNVWSGWPVKASTSRMMEPLVETSSVLPSGENLTPVQSHSFSWLSLNVVNGP